VAHFMMKDFSDADCMNSDMGLDEMQTVLQIVDFFEDCRVITVPLGAFSLLRPIDVAAYQAIFVRCCEKVCRLLELVEQNGRRLALEVIPGAIIGGTDGFLRLCEHIETYSLGFNFDTGHAWAAKENLYLIPAKLGKRILGTHLCDNWGHDNLSLRPGKGSIDWRRIISALQAAEYKGPYDIEIVCEPNKVKEEYRRGRDYIINLMDGEEPASV
jgi:sugar phosphate isomerase/epimerase